MKAKIERGGSAARSIGVAGLVVASLSACNCAPLGPSGAGQGWDGRGPAPSGTALSEALSRSEAGPMRVDCVHRGSGTDYAVGPGQKYARLGDVPFERLGAGDTVRVHHRAEPYREKLMIGGIGTAEQPIRICGVPGPGGELPLLEGRDATTRKEQVFPFDGHQARGVIVVGRPNDAPWAHHPSHIVIEGLDIRGAAPPNQFIDREGKRTTYAEPAAGVFVQRGSHITVRGCAVSENHNGLFIGSAGDVELTIDVLIEGNHVHGNGNPEAWYQHNVYNEASGVLYQFNRFGPPRGGPRGVLGGNIKDRSAGIIVRYNWIEDGARLLDLVDAQEAVDRTLTMPSYRETWVVGNVFVRGPVPNGAMIHYGGDSGIMERYRKGTLHFVHNTVVVYNDHYPDWQGAAVFELSTDEEKLESWNNLYVTSSKPSRRSEIILFGERDQQVRGRGFSHGDFFSEGMHVHDTQRAAKLDVTASFEGFDAAMKGGDPGFVDLAGGDFRLKDDASVLGKGVKLDAVPEERRPTMQYQRHRQGKPRTLGDPPTPGALGRASD